MVTRKPAPARTAAAPVMVMNTAIARGSPSFCSQNRIGSESTVTNTATMNGMRMESAARSPGDEDDERRRRQQQGRSRVRE